MDKKIPTYVINLKKRPDRKEHILNEFIDKPEFEVKVVEAIEHTNGDCPIKCVNKKYGVQLCSL